MPTSLANDAIETDSNPMFRTNPKAVFKIECVLSVELFIARL